MKIIIEHFYLGGTLLFIAFLGVTGTFSFYWVEATVNPEVNTLLDSMWWTINMITTTGTANIDPVTTTGRYIGMSLMSLGILSIGVLAASMASYIVRKGVKKDLFRHIKKSR